MELDEEISKTKMFQAIQLKGYTDNSIKKIKKWVMKYQTHIKVVILQNLVMIIQINFMNL